MLRLVTLASPALKLSLAPYRLNGIRVRQQPRKLSSLAQYYNEAMRPYNRNQEYKRYYSSKSSDQGSGAHSNQGAPIGNIFDLTPEQYQELKERKTPLDHEYTEFKSEQEPLQEVEWQPGMLDFSGLTDLISKKRYLAAIKCGSEMLAPHAQVIRSGFPFHDPSLHSELRHELSEVLSLMCVCYIHLERLDLAIDSLMTASNLYPTADNYSDLASHLFSAERYEEALIASDKALELDPRTEVDALIIKAYSLYKLEKFDHDILAICDLALARDPYATSAMLVKARVLEHHGKTNEALKTIDRAIARDDQDWDLVLYKSQLLQKTGQPQLAITSVKKFLPEDPENVEVRRELIKLSFLAEEFDLAVEHLKWLVEKEKVGFSDLSYALIQSGQVAEAERALATAIEKDAKKSIFFPTPYSFPVLKRKLTLLKKMKNT